MIVLYLVNGTRQKHRPIYNRRIMGNHVCGMWPIEWRQTVCHGPMPNVMAALSNIGGALC